MEPLAKKKLPYMCHIWQEWRVVTDCGVVICNCLEGCMVEELSNACARMYVCIACIRLCGLLVGFWVLF